MAKERVVVVGAGGISKAWFGPLKAERLDVAAVVDLNPDAARSRIAEFALDCEASTDLKATLRKHKPTLVVDLTVPEAHCEVTCTALRAGCHVIGEKPMAASLPEARRMVRTAEKAGRCYMVSQSRRWMPQHETLARTVRQGKIGTLTTVNCDYYMGPHFGGFREEMPSPLVLDMAIHHFDLARQFSGTDPVAVYAKEYNPAGSWYAGDAAAACVFEMTGGVIFTYRGSWCAEGCPTPWAGNWRLIGDRGTLLYEREEPPFGEVVAGKTGFQRAGRPINPRPVKMPHGTMRGALREMLACLRGGKTPQTECHDNIKSLAMVFAAIESSRRGRRVPVRGM